MAKAAKQTVVGSIHIYGTTAGAGYLLAGPQGLIRTEGADGEPHAGRSLTQAAWLAADDLRSFYGLRAGTPAAKAAMVEVHYDFPQGPKMAVVPLYRLPYWGDMPWTAAAMIAVEVAG